MKKRVVFFLSGLLFLGFCLSSSAVAGEGEVPPGFGTGGGGYGRGIYECRRG